MAAPVMEAAVRSEGEMLGLIVETARADERIRAVIMNGSRANPNAPKDIFQDYDIVYFSKDISPFVRNPEWLARFGELMILQTPDDMGDPPPARNGSYAYLMQFMDGNRIDLTLAPLSMIAELSSDSQTIVLLDKDGSVPALPPASDRDYLPKPPDAKAFADCCNEFWWMSPYVAKGLWRREILYAKDMMDRYLREQLMKMVSWRIGAATGQAGNPGKSGKYVQRFLDAREWESLLRTYADAGYQGSWEALYASCGLFREMAMDVAGRYGFEYPLGDDTRVSAHLERVRRLPADAKEIG
jgi:aminoglycoside 6-adenylyltransferase